MLARLALAFGIPLGELGDRLSAEELLFWEAFERVEGPIGFSRLDLVGSYLGMMSGKSFPKEATEMTAFASYRTFWRFIVNPPKTPEEMDEEERLEYLSNKVFSLFGFPPGYEANQ